MRSEDWQKRGTISHFTVMRKLEGSILPIGLTKEASDRNQKAGSNVLALESRWVLLSRMHFTCYFEQIQVLIFAFINLFYSIFSERALFNRLMIELSKLDCDVLVGHNISGFDLDVLLHRAQVFIIIFLINLGTSCFDYKVYLMF